MPTHLPALQGPAEHLPACPPACPPHCLQRRRGSRADPVTEDDLLRAIERLAGLGSGFGVVKIGARQFVRSMPTELSTDSNVLIELAEVRACAGACVWVWVGWGVGGLVGKDAGRGCRIFAAPIVVNCGLTHTALLP